MWRPLHTAVTVWLNTVGSDDTGVLLAVHLPVVVLLVPVHTGGRKKKDSLLLFIMMLLLLLLLDVLRSTFHCLLLFCTCWTFNIFFCLLSSFLFTYFPPLYCLTDEKKTSGKFAVSSLMFVCQRSSIWVAVSVNGAAGAVCVAVGGG